MISCHIRDSMSLPSAGLQPICTLLGKLPLPQKSTKSVELRQRTKPWYLLFSESPASMEGRFVAEPAVLSSSITRVLATSRGVVVAAANPPAILPQTAASHEYGLRLAHKANCDFSHSYRGNWIEVNGISRTIVVPNPLSSPLIPSVAQSLWKLAREPVAPPWCAYAPV